MNHRVHYTFRPYGSRSWSRKFATDTDRPVRLRLVYGRQCRVTEFERDGQWYIHEEKDCGDCVRLGFEIFPRKQQTVEHFAELTMDGDIPAKKITEALRTTGWEVSHFTV